MSRPEEAQRRAWAETGGAAVASALLYLSGALFMFFLVPLGALAVRRGSHGYQVAAVATLLVIAVTRGVQAGGALTPLLLLGEVSMPGGILLGFATIPAAGRRIRPWAYRFALAVGIATVGALPVMVALGNAPGFEGVLEAQLVEVMQNLGAEDPQIAAEMIVEEAMEMVFRSFALLFALIIGLGALLGRHLVSRFSAEEPYTPPVDRVAVPDESVWPLLVGWALVAMNALAGIGFLGYLGWNLALVFTLIFAVQGVGVTAALASRSGMTARSRRLAAVGLVVSLFVPGVNMAIALAIPALGVSELWVDYKREKETYHEGNS
ncbi:MAG: DUF2232 domain-containing protein [Spirochaetaceae bacterium]